MPNRLVAFRLTADVYDAHVVAFDLDFARDNFPAFALPEYSGRSFFENAGGSLACRQTIEALHHYYLHTKVQPYAEYGPSAAAGDLMDSSRQRWADTLGVMADQVHFGPSTSMNTYVLAQAFARLLGPSDEVIVTNQDHEANTGAVRRMAIACGAKVREWRADPATGLLDGARLESLLSEQTRLVCFPHCSNIVGQENPIGDWVNAAKRVGARVIVDGVSFAPHGLVDLAGLGADVYLFSLYKVYSVHQGLMVTANGLVDELPNQGHYFNEEYASKRLTPAGPDHAQEAAAGAVLDYFEALADHHGAEAGTPRQIAAAVSALWQDHERLLAEPVLEWLTNRADVRLVGPSKSISPDLHRCPTVSFVPRAKSSAQVAHELVEQSIMCGSGDFYAARLLEGLDIDPDQGVVRLSWVHYTSPADIDRLLGALEHVLG